MFRNFLKKIIIAKIIFTFFSVHSQSIYDNTYDKYSKNGIRKNENNRVIIVDSKKMTVQDIAFYTGGGTNAGDIENNFWNIISFNGYGHYSSPFYKYPSDKNYSLIVEYEIAANFDTKYEAPYAYIDIYNDGNVIHEHPIKEKSLGEINGSNTKFTKIRIKVEHIPYAFNLQPRLRTVFQKNKKIYIKSITAYLIKPAY
nr:hypothetical protein GTC16762_05890 [Pigmentibacter ruber]